MNKLTFLGTASAVPDSDQQNSHLVVEAMERSILVDCVGNPVVRLKQAGIDPLSITDLIVTHFHPDHVSGVPLLLMDLWLMGRTNALNLYGLPDVLDRITKMMALYDWETWEGFYPVNFVQVIGNGLISLIDTEGFKVFAAEVSHMVPTMGIRMTTNESVVCYSSDTEPCDSILQLAQNADILIHEATGEGNGHTSPEQAGQVAHQTGTGKLFLIHYPANADTDEWIKRAQINFSGEVIAARDLMTIEFP